MATYTENFDLIKPDDEDYYDVADFNANMDIIDEALAESAGSADKIGEPADTVLNTVFGKLNGFISPDGQGVRIIKSIQHHVIVLDGNIENGVYHITPVNAARSFVLFERLGDPINTPNQHVTYSLHDDHLKLKYSYSQLYVSTVGFWIIEFY